MSRTQDVLFIYYNFSIFLKCSDYYEVVNKSYAKARDVLLIYHHFDVFLKCKHFTFKISNSILFGKQRLFLKLVL